jgi:phosphoglycolate phosphatase
VQTSATIRLAVFDLDGTLIDSRGDLATATNALILELGGSRLSDAAVGDMVGEGAGLLVRRALTASGLDPETPGALERFLELYSEHLLDTTRLYDGMIDVLDALASRVHLAILTNKPQLATRQIVEGLDLQRFFSVVIGGDTSLGRKPDPTGLLHVARLQGSEAPETLLIGDSPVDLDTARRAGVRICLASYGFGYRTVALRRGERVVSTPAQLMDLIIDQRS